MRKIVTSKSWLIDLMLLQRDSFSLHLFSLVVIKGTREWLRTPDIKIPMRIKAIPIKLPKVLREAYDILKSKQ